MISNIFVDILVRILTIIVICDLAIWWVIKKQIKPTTGIVIFVAILEIIAIVINLWWVLVYRS